MGKFFAFSPLFQTLSSECPNHMFSQQNNSFAKSVRKKYHRYTELGRLQTMPLKLASLVICVCSLQSATAQPIDVMTFNIRGSGAERSILDDDLPYRWVANNWTTIQHPSRATRVLSAIAQAEPDILGVQELDFSGGLFNQFDDLNSFMSDQGYGTFSRTRNVDPDAWDSHDAIFWNEDRFVRNPLTSDGGPTAGTFWLSDTPNIPGSISLGAGFPRTANWVILYDEIAEHEVFVLNTHWSYRTDPEDTFFFDLQGKAAEVISDQLPSLAGGRPIVITGDMNVGQDNDALDETLEMGVGLTNVTNLPSSHPASPGATGGSFHLPWTSEGELVNLSFVNRDPIDHILVSDDFVIHSARVARELGIHVETERITDGSILFPAFPQEEINHDPHNLVRDDIGQDFVVLYPSDHFPVLASIEFLTPFQRLEGTTATLAGDWSVRTVQVDTGVAGGFATTSLETAERAIGLDNNDVRVMASAETMESVINFGDGERGRFDEDQLFEVSGDDFAVEATARIVIAEDGDYIFGFGGDDGGRLCLDGADFTLLNERDAAQGVTRPDGANAECIQWAGNTGNSDTFGTTFMLAGEYDLEVLWWERGGAEWLEVYTGIGDTAAGEMTLQLLGDVATDWERGVGTPSPVEDPTPVQPTLSGVWSVRTVQVDTGAEGGFATTSLETAERAIGLDNNDVRVMASAETMESVINFGDGERGRFDEDQLFEVSGDDFAVEATARIVIAEDGDYIFGFGGDDGGRLCLDGADFTLLNERDAAQGVTRPDGANAECIQWAGNTGNSDTFGTTFMLAGEYDLEVLWWERGGAEWLEVYAGVGDTAAGEMTFQLLGSQCNPNTLGDIDDDGMVGFPDFLILSNNFGQDLAGHSLGDVDCNGSVNFSDFLILSANFGATAGAEASTSAVPEPNCFGLLSIGLLGVAAAFRRRS